jgi:hypothetical protein
VYDHFAALDVVCKLDANGDKASVWESARPYLAGNENAELVVTGAAVAHASAPSSPVKAKDSEPAAPLDFGATKLVFVLGGPGSGKGTLCERYARARRSLPLSPFSLSWLRL